MFYKLPSLPAIPDYLKQQIIDIAFTQRQQVVPTFGFFPVIIDMGLSYCSSLEGQPTTSPIEHFDKGLQTSVFDKFNELDTTPTKKLIHQILILILHKMQI